MANSLYVRSRLAQAALEHVPPLVRKSLLEDSSFQAEYDLFADGVLRFSDSGLSIRRSDLFKAVRMVLSGTATAEITDMDNQDWELKNIITEKELPRLVISREKQQSTLPDLSILSPDSETRLRYLDETASDVNLPSSVRDKWSNILGERALEDDEVDTFLSEIRDTPIEKTRSIRSEILTKNINISSLVPHSRRYYERLIGTYEGSSSIRDYATSSCKTLFNQLATWRPYDGFLLSLLLSSHLSLTAEIKVDHLDKEDIIRALDFLDKHGDRISQLGAIEVGLRILTSLPEVKPILIHLIDQIFNDNDDESASGFSLLSALFILVDGELSRTRLLSTEPPFYRRLAALSQAGLIYRQLINSTINIDHFVEWAMGSRKEQFYLQSLADMRLEPRWNPDYAVASQMKADFVGRLMITVRNYEQEIDIKEISDLILRNSLRTFPSPSDLIRLYLPGPLEGMDVSHATLSKEIAEEIQTQLSREEVGPSSFFALVNSALIFRVSLDQAELAAKVLKLGSYRLAKIEDKSQLLAVLNGLAAVAAVARSSTLADELRILVRIYRRDTQYALTIGDATRICIIASASRTDLKEWRDFAGDWLTELAFSDFEGNDGVILHEHLQHLCHVVPELWVSCGRADAALMAYNASRH